MMNINVKTSIYPARQDTIIYKNKNIKKLDVFLKEMLDTNLNINNLSTLNSKVININNISIYNN